MIKCLWVQYHGGKLNESFFADDKIHQKHVDSMECMKRAGIVREVVTLPLPTLPQGEVLTLA